MTIDPVDLTAELIRCESVTPAEGGALVLLQDVLQSAGFVCTRIDRNGVSNLHARWGTRGHARSFGFNGHTDVVPVGNPDDWTLPPFGGDIRDGLLFGRGATDMKSGVAAFVAAAVRHVTETPPEGAVVLTITGDEEGEATDGTTAILDWMADEGEVMSVCLVGEPTCPERLGDMIKIGRRGSMTGFFTITGVQGHSAYPHRARNPLPALARLADRLARHRLDDGNEHFDPSTLALTTIDTGNPANNVIPAVARFTANIRFNDQHSSADLSEWLRSEADQVAAEFGVDIDIRFQVSGESFVTPPGELSGLVSDAVTSVTGLTPEMSTTGGTSDARFIKSICPVVEFGLVGKTMHQVDECVEVGQIRELTRIYGEILNRYFA